MQRNTKNILLVLDTIPQHNGTPRARLAYLHYRALSCCGKTSVLVLDLQGTEYAHRAKLTPDVLLVPMYALYRQVSWNAPAPEITLSSGEVGRLKRSIQKACDDPSNAIIVAQDRRLAALIEQTMPSGQDLQVLSDKSSTAEFSRTVVAPLISYASGKAMVGKPERLAVVLSGDPTIDQKVCEAIDREVCSMNLEIGSKVHADVFGGSPHDYHGRSALHHRDWRDLTGVLAASWLLIDLLSEENGGEYLRSMIAGFDVAAAVPLGANSRSISDAEGRVAEYASTSELGSILRSSYSRAAERDGINSIPEQISIYDILVRYSDCFGLRAPKKTLPKSFNEFYFSGPNARRRVPYKHQPTAYFVPATGLLCIQAFVRHSSGVNEVRIVDDKSEEIGRIVPSKMRPELPYLPIEGGVILHGVDSAPSITLQFFESGKFCSEMSIASSEVSIVNSELVSLDFAGGDHSRAIGLVWSEKPGEQLELFLPPASRHRLAPPAPNGSTPNAPSWTSFDITGFVEPTPRAVVRLMGNTNPSILRRPIHLGKAFADPLFPHSDALEQRHNVLAGRRAWIIGNGPSVRHADLNLIADQGDVIFCFNRFYMAYPETRLREDYLVSADRLMIQDFGPEIITQSSGLPLFCVDRDEATELEGEYLRVNKLDVAMPLFSRNASRFVHVGGSSVFVALQLAYYFGIREVLTYGLDYSFSQTPVFDPRYSIPVCFDEGNHFIRGYRSEKPWVPPNWRDISFGFLKSRVAFEAAGGRILNATRGGKLEIFDRIDFDEAVKQGAFSING